MLPEPLFLNIHMYGIILLMILLEIILIFVIKNLYQRNGK